MTRSSLMKMTIFGLVGLVVAALTALLLLQLPGGPPAYGGPFALQATTGQRLDRSSLSGRPYALFFGYTNCPDFCPTTMLDLAELMNAEGGKAKDFKAYFITIDPARDSADHLKAYLASFDPRIVGLTGSEEDISSIVRSFKIYRKKVGEGETYTFDHTSSVLLFDAKGGLAGLITASEPFGDQKAKLDRLLDG